MMYERKKIDGNYLWWVLCVSSMLVRVDLSFGTSVILRLVHSRGGSVSRVAVGEACAVQVEVTGEEELEGWPRIAGLDSFYHGGTQQRREISYSNGTRTTRTVYSITITPNTMGSYRIGPAECRMRDGSMYTTGLCTLEVTERIAKTAKADNGTRVHGSADTFVRWEINKSDIYAGEIVPCRLCIYTTDESVRLQGRSAAVPQSESLQIVVQDTPVWDVVQEGGNTYHRGTWDGYLYVIASGTYWLPMVTVQYTSEEEDPAHYTPFTMMARFLRGTQVHERHAQAMRVQVMPLPATAKDVVGVGTVITCDWQIDKRVISVGDAFIAKRTILSSCEPSLLRLPQPAVAGDAVRWYQSTTKIEGEVPLRTYTVEYIVQALQPGEWELSSQDLVFFNPETRRYETMHCESVPFTIVPSANTQTGIDASDEAPRNTSHDLSMESENTTVDKALPAADAIEMRPRPLREVDGVSVYTLVLGCIIPMLIVLLWYMTNGLLGQLYRWCRLRYIAYLVQRRIERASRERSGYMLREAFIFCGEYMIGDRYISLKSWVTQYPLSPEMCTRWYAWCDALDRLSFAQMDTVPWESRVAEAYEWLGEWYRVVRGSIL